MTHRRQFPQILLYSFGLALALSLGFNGFLLYEQSHTHNLYDYDLGYSVQPANYEFWQQELADCKRTNQQKDSLIYRLAQAPNAPPDKAIAIQRSPSK